MDLGHKLIHFGQALCFAFAMFLSDSALFKSFTAIPQLRTVMCGSKRVAIQLTRLGPRKFDLVLHGYIDLRSGNALEFINVSMPHTK